MGKNGREKKLGPIQTAIIALLWDKEMYGLEILTQLKLKGKATTKSQLYPALNKMDEAGLLESRLVPKVGADRKYYRSTNQAKEIIMLEMLDIGFLFVDTIYERLDYLEEQLTSFIQTQPHMDVLDVSDHFSEQVIAIFAPSLENGRYFKTAETDDQGQLYSFRLDYHELSNIVKVLVGQRTFPEVPNNSIDYVFSFFTVHHPENIDWIFKEAERVLKPGGEVIVVEMKGVRDHFIYDLLKDLLGGADVIGLDPDKLDRLKPSGFKVKRQKIYRGILFLALSLD